MKTIERAEYLQWLERWKDKQIIKVVSGVRRCGKSTLFEIYKNKLLKSGVKKEQIISINFEDFAFENLTQAKALYEYITPLLLNDEMNYIFRRTYRLHSHLGSKHHGIHLKVRII